MRVVAETPQLIIRTWHESDLASYGALLGEEDAADLVKFNEDGPECRAENELWRYQLEQDRLGWSRWAVIHKKSHQFMGYCGFSPYHHDVEISWRFFPEYRGKGLAIEAIEAVVRVGLNQLGFKKVISFTSPANHHTLHVMKQVGMTLDRIEGWGQCTAVCYSLSSTGY